MTKLNQIRYTTYSDPRAKRSSQGNLISLNGDDSYLLNTQEVTQMELFTKSPDTNIPVGDVSNIIMGFRGQASGGFKFTVFVRHNDGDLILYESDFSRDYTDTSVPLEVPALVSPRPSYPVLYIVESADGITAPASGVLAKEDGTPLTLTFNGPLGLGRVLKPVGVGTVVRTQDGGVVKYQGVSNDMKLGTSGPLTFPSGQPGYQDFFPYAIFNVPNTSSAKFVIKITLDKSVRAELGMIARAPNLILLNPAVTTPILVEQVYLDTGLGVNKPEPIWAFPGAFNAGADVIAPSNVNTKLGTVEYEIPASTVGAALALFSYGFPFNTARPFRDNFEGVDYRNRERAMGITFISMYVKNTALESVPSPYREIVFDLSTVLSTSTAKSFTMNASFGPLDMTAGISNKIIPRVNVVTYIIKPNQAGLIEVKVGSGTQNYTYRGTIAAGTDLVTVQLVPDSGNINPTTTLNPIPVTYDSSLDSYSSYRQSQNINPWTSRDILITVNAWAGNPINKVVFQSSDIKMSATNLPPGTVVNITPMSASGSSIVYKAVISNKSNVPVKVGQSVVNFTTTRVSGTPLSSTPEIFKVVSFLIYVDPKVEPTTTLPPAGTGESYQISSYTWTRKPSSIFQIKGKVGGLWSYTPIDFVTPPKVGVDSDGFVYGIGIAMYNKVFRGLNYPSSYAEYPFLYDASILKEDPSPYKYVEVDYYMSTIGGLNGSVNFFAAGESGKSDPKFIPNPDWINFNQRTNDRTASDVASKTESVVKFISGRYPTGGYFARSSYLDILLFPRDLTTVGTMAHQSINVSGADNVGFRLDNTNNTNNTSVISNPDF